LTTEPNPVYAVFTVTDQNENLTFRHCEECGFIDAHDEECSHYDDEDDEDNNYDHHDSSMIPTFLKPYIPSGF
jgi:hypothetical protein